MWAGLWNYSANHSHIIALNTDDHLCYCLSIASSSPCCSLTALRKFNSPLIRKDYHVQVAYVFCLHLRVGFLVQNSSLIISCISSRAHQQYYLKLIKYYFVFKSRSSSLLALVFHFLDFNFVLWEISFPFEDPRLHFKVFYVFFQVDQILRNLNWFLRILISFIVFDTLL